MILMLIKNKLFQVTCIYNDHSLYVWDVNDILKIGKKWSFLYHSSCIYGLEVRLNLFVSISVPDMTNVF